MHKKNIHCCKPTCVLLRDGVPVVRPQNLELPLDVRVSFGQCGAFGQQPQGLEDGLEGLAGGGEEGGGAESEGWGGWAEGRGTHSCKAGQETGEGRKGFPCCPPTQTLRASMPCRTLVRSRQSMQLVRTTPCCLHTTPRALCRK